jgi:hypothetical protein
MLIIPLPHWVTTNAALMNVAAWGLLVVEALIGILVWNKRLRLPALAVGVTLHLFVMLTIAVGFFTPAMFVLYLAFASPETIRDLPTRLKAFAGSRRPRRRRQATITPATIPAEPERTGEPVPS